MPETDGGKPIEHGVYWTRQKSNSIIRHSPAACPAAACRRCPKELTKDVKAMDFYTGHAFDAYTVLGAHPGPEGTRFAVWAPSAQKVEVVGDWAPEGVPLCRDSEISGVWSGVCPQAEKGMCYFYRITGADGSVVDHCDPYGFAMTLRPDGRSIVAGLPDYRFGDRDWMASRTKNFDSPLNIYELHAASGRRHPDGRWYTYDDLAAELPGYLLENGYTHAEFLPLMEHPFDGSWGYQITGFYAPTSRYGSPEGLCRLIDACHQAGIGVILDFVPVHFASDSYGLARFDGTPLYEYPASDVGESEWGSGNFMHSRGEVRCFLQSCADYWLRVFHVDGLRMDAVSRLIYWQGDPARGVNGSTLDFLKTMNAGLQALHPSAMLIAEDSTAFPKVTAPVEYDGLGFDYKWDMGWMHDTLSYFQKSPAERRANPNLLTFSMVYNYQEHYILPFSHDENVHGKATILQKMNGDYDGKFPQGRALYLYMMLHPGKKLDFMGNEFGQLREWDESRPQDWELFRYPNHDSFYHFRQELGRLYRQYDVFWNGELNPERFAWLDCDSAGNGTFALQRHGPGSSVFGVFCFGDQETDYTLTMPGAGYATLLLDSNWQCFSGTAPRPDAPVTLTANMAGRLTLHLAPLSGQLWRWQPK